MMFKEEYKSRLRHHVKLNKDEWENIRSFRFAKHLMAAVAFRESAQATMEQTGSVILTPIGFYYSLFHLSVAAFFIDYRAELSSLTNMRHKPLINRVKSKLLSSGFVSQHYVDTLERLKNDREYANYQFAVRMKDDFYEIAPNYYRDTDICFQNVTDYFLAIENEIKDLIPFGFRVRVGIADGYGDDILQTYLSVEYKSRVNNWLAQNGLQA